MKIISCTAASKEKLATGTKIVFCVTQFEEVHFFF